MPKDFPRSDRMGQQIQRELSGLIRNNIKDPRVGLVTVVEVVVTRDLSHATVWFSSLTDTDRDEMTAALNHAAGYLRSELGRRISARTTPQLHFSYDDSTEKGLAMSKLIDAVIDKDIANSSSDKDD